jgi:hypothetical protein
MMSRSLATLMQMVSQFIDRMRLTTSDELEVKAEGDQAFRAIRKRDVSLPAPDYVLIEFVELRSGAIIVRRIAGPAEELFQAIPNAVVRDTYEIGGEAATASMLVSQAMERFDFA